LKRVGQLDTPLISRKGNVAEQKAPASKETENIGISGCYHIFESFGTDLQLSFAVSFAEEHGISAI